MQSTVLPVHGDTPALFTAKSSRPNSLKAVETVSCATLSFETSPMTVTAFPPDFSMSASFCSSGSRLCPQMTMLAPNAEKAIAVA